MGVYYKGVNMPKDCIVCPFGWNGCNEQHDFVYMGSRPDNSPLIEVPEPHGRLIDADAVILEGGPYEYDDWCKWALGQYQDAQTVIPASGKG
jgi:hypothetical protein